MLQMQNEIKKKDLEKYEVIIPFFDIAGKRKKQFLSSELEKLHPCFSDEFAFDSGFKKISKKGMLADVLVVNKYKLAEYEQRRRFSGRGFFLERDLSAPKPRVLQKIFFVSPKWKLTYFSLAVCLLVGSCGLIFGAFSGRWLSKNKEDAFEVSLEKSLFQSAGDTAPAAPAAPADSADSSELTDSTDSLSLSEAFFDCVSSARSFAGSYAGVVSLFEWKVQGYTEKLSASLSGFFPENLEGMKNVSGLMQNERLSSGNTSVAGTESAAVIYEQQIPRMKVSYNRKILQSSSPDFINSKAGPNNKLSNSDFNKCLRDLIIAHSGFLQEENAPPYHIEFTCLAEAEESKKMLEEIAVLVTKEERQISSIFISPRYDEKKRRELRIGLSIEELPFTGFDLKLISKNISLFRASVKNDTELQAQKPSALVSKQNNVSTRENSSWGEKNSGEKIGEIKKSDNSILVFFKTPEGKIQTKIILK